MFKRVGATIVTIVMLLSMASVFSSASGQQMELAVELVDSNGDSLSSVTRGEALKAIVKVVNPVSLSGMTVVGEYDTSLFELDEEEEIEIEQLEIDGTVFHGEMAENDDVEIAVTWMANENVTMVSDTLLLTVPLKVKEDAALCNANISFRFSAEGMAKKSESGTPVELEAAAYSADPVEFAITIDPTTQTSLEVDAPANAEVGEIIDVVVKVKDYAANWSTLSIIGTYNPDVLTPVEESVVPGSFNESAIIEETVVEIEGGDIAVVWVNEDVVNNAADFEALRLSFEVTGIGDANLSFSFKEDGIVGANKTPIKTGFEKAPVKKDINITLPAEDVALEIEVPANVKKDDTIYVKVNVKNYADAWAVMTIKGTYDADKLQLQDIISEDFKDTVSNTEAVEEFDESKGLLAVTWINKEAVVKGPEFTAMTLEFKVKDVGDADLSFSFVPDGIKGANGAAVSTDDFETTSEETISIQPADLKTELGVAVIEDSAKVGETVTVKVDVNNYANNWAIMTIKGTYDPAQFELIKEECDLEEFKDDGITEEPVFEVDNDKGILAVTWINDDVVTKADTFPAMTLTFKVLSQGDGTGEFNFSFVPDGIRDADGQKITEGFDTDEKTGDVVLLPADVKTSLSVAVKEEEEENKDSFKVGETVTYVVSVKDYRSNWQTMTILAKYDSAKLRYTGATNKITTGFSGFNAEPSQVVDDTVGISWINEVPVTLSENFGAVELTFVVEKEGAAEVSFKFEPTGIVIGKDPATSENIFAPEDSYVKDWVSQSVTLLPISSPPYLEIVGEDNVNERGEYTVDLVLKDYADQWSSFAAYLEYDADKFEYISAEKNPFGDAVSFVEKVGNQIRVVVMPNGLGNIAAAKENTILSVKFTAKEDGNAEFNASIVEPHSFDASSQISIPAIEGTYKKDAEKKNVAIANTSFTNLELDTNNVGTVEQFEEVTINMNLKGYEKNWSSFGAELFYDANVFTIEDASKVVGTFGGEQPNVDLSVPGTIRLDWSKNDANIEAEESLLVSVTFKANGYGDNVEFKANLLDVKKFDGNAHVDVDENDYAPTSNTVSVNIQKRKMPYLTMEIVPDNGTVPMKEGEKGTVKIYLNDYTGAWCSVPVALKFNPDLIQIEEGEIKCNPLGSVEGQALLREDDGKIIFTWLSLNNISAADNNVLLAEIPFEAYQDGDAIFGAEFIADNIFAEGASDPVASDSFIPKADEQTVTIEEDGIVDLDPMVLVIDAASKVTKNKKDTLALKLTNFNSNVQALSVKLFYDKDNVTITEEDIAALKIDDDADVVSMLNADEGYIQFTWAKADAMKANDTTITLANIKYIATKIGQISFYAEIDQLVEFDEDIKEPTKDYVERSETVYVDVKSVPYLSVEANKTNVKVGDTVTVTVYVNDYIDLWSAMTINGSYNNKLLKLESITQSDSFNSEYKHLVHEDGEETLKATWFGTKNIKADDKFDALVLVFKAIEGGTAKFDFSFEKNHGILTEGVTPMKPGVDFVVDAQEVDEIVIAACDHDWSKKPVHKDGTFGKDSKHILTCGNGCGTTKEVACSVKQTVGKATCDKSGTITYKCALCGYNEKVNNPKAPALGHKFGKPAHKAGTKKHVYTCTRGCGTTKEENCSYKTQVVQRTCLKDGYTIFTCTTCNDRYTGKVVKAVGKHGTLVLHYIAPTVSTNGSIITQCDNCKEYVVPPYAGAVKKTLKAGHPFPDVQNPKSWYYDAVNFSKAFEIFVGGTDGNFGSSDNITRGQLVTVLGRIIMAEAEKKMSASEFNAFLNAQTSKVSGMKSTSGFKDLNGKYYERYAKLFAKWGIVNGYPDGTFGGDRNITRDEMATMIKRFIEAYRGSTENIKFGNAATFKDFAKVGGWAKANVEWVGKVGLFQGDANKNYNPTSNATRAEIAVVIYRMLPVLKNICVCSLNH